MSLAGVFVDVSIIEFSVYALDDSCFSVNISNTALQC